MVLDNTDKEMNGLQATSRKTRPLSFKVRPTTNLHYTQC